MMVVLALFGGMALLLYGIRLSGDSLQRAAGARLRHLLTGLARNRFLALVSGATVTVFKFAAARITSESAGKLFPRHCPPLFSALNLLTQNELMRGLAR